MTTRPLICATVTAPAMADLVRERDGVKGADLVEIRLDTPSAPDVDAALLDRRLPVVVTCRSRSEGGLFRGSEEERRSLLMRALAGGAEFVDLEWRSGFDEVIRARQGRGIVLSHHDFSGVPADLADRAEAMLNTGAEIVKIAVMATSLCDCLPLLRLSALHPGRKMVLIAMGDVGLVTRVFAGRIGSCWIFAGAGVAPGQITVDQLQREFRVQRIGANTGLYGLIGRDIGHSKLPAMHNAGFEDLNEDAAYVPLPASSVDDAMRFASEIGLAGASVVAPYSGEIASRLDQCDARALSTGTVSAIVRRDGRFEGTNTDLPTETAPEGNVPNRGRGSASGIAQLVEQTQIQQKWWTGRTPNRDALIAAAEWTLSPRTET